MRRYQSAAQMALDLAHPAEEADGAGAQVKQDGWLQVYDRWKVARRIKRIHAPDFGRADCAVLIIVVAVDLSPEGEKFIPPRRQIKRMLVTEPTRGSPAST